MSDRKWLVLFDIDGTLLHSGGCGRAATRLALQEVFGTIGVLDGYSFAGKTDWQILREALTPAGITAEQVEAKLHTYNTVVARHLTEIIGDFPVKPCVGAREVVAALSANPAAVVALVTGNMEKLVPIKLHTAGYTPADFKVGAFGSEGWVRSMLPPLALERARTYSKVDFPPERIVIIGDTPGDVACAASIGARTIAVATGPFSAAQLSAHRPTHVFETMADQDAVLSAIFDGHIT
ncbi:MAG: HAD hydrolase-like protein [Anaerolineae bacterium]|nr:HAD hydrolase-like protein [Anaerolineae bacterium]